MTSKSQRQSVGSIPGADPHPAFINETDEANQSAIQSSIRIALGKVGLSTADTGAVIAALPPNTLGALLYGSRARGDTTSYSDFDILALTSQMRSSIRVGAVSVACYSEDLLNSASGTLFGMHLKRDGVILYDPEGMLARGLRRLKQPDPDELDARLRRYFSILMCVRTSGDPYLPGLIRVARYLLRTAVYNSALRSGSPSFSVRDLALRFADPNLEVLLSSHAEVQGPTSTKVLIELTGRLSSVLKIEAGTTSDTLHAIIVRNWFHDPGLSRLAMLALSTDAFPLDYSSLPMVIL